MKTSQVGNGKRVWAVSGLDQTRIHPNLAYSTLPPYTHRIQKDRLNGDFSHLPYFLPFHESAEELCFAIQYGCFDGYTYPPSHCNGLFDVCIRSQLPQAVELFTADSAA